MSKLVVKDYQKTATEGQPRALYTIPTDLHSLLPIPSSNMPWPPLKIQALASFVPSQPCVGWTEQNCLQRQIRGQANSPGRRTGQNMLMHCIAWPQCGFNRDAAPDQTYRKILDTPKLGIRNADSISANHSN